MQWTMVNVHGEHLSEEWPDKPISQNVRRHYAAVLGCAIQSFLNNDWQSSLLSVEAGRRTYWPIGEIPFDEKMFYGR